MSPVFGGPCYVGKDSPQPEETGYIDIGDALVIFYLYARLQQTHAATVTESAYGTINQGPGDEQTIKKLTIGVHQKRLMDIVRARDPSKVYIWSSEAPAQNEAKVVSLRAFEQNMSRETPKFGNRLTVQALVRFETVQKLDVYTKTGKLIQPSEPKRVVEYLIFQKRMWYDTPWAIRDQLYEGLQGKIQHM
ncbi:hypothetical protein EUX98_g6288 [Antrodiella citrinella]|uniref:Tim44-like domain-containing protein n=1 Tax=Antrodiella citrinella TaxID=2447956 RepID=A0A4S4MPB4_9APHY|nr:hypothetical protein EUX98_g6288 [Antrodiella citrinella]